MESSCDEGSCKTGSSCGSGCDGEESCEACGTSCGGDPTECGSAMWHRAFFEAMRELQVETIKAKLQKAWGAKMEKAADIIIEAAGTKWQSMLAQAKAKEQVREKLRQLWQEGK